MQKLGVAAILGIDFVKLDQIVTCHTLNGQFVSRLYSASESFPDKSNFRGIVDKVEERGAYAFLTTLFELHHEANLFDLFVFEKQCERFD